MDWIKQFNELGKDDIALVGGKGASLGEMTQAGLPVPPGFVITTDAFRDFGSGEWSPEFKQELHTAFEQLGSEFVAVRSSATAEDSADTSCAGILETYLNTTKETLEANILKCWQSAYSPRAQSYCVGQKLLVAVVIQAMVPSEIAGITFTVHPVTQNRNQIIIEACWGLGELIVGGQCTPDSYVIDRLNQTIIEEDISPQEEMIVRGTDGNQTIAVSPELSQQRKLSVHQILELGKICERIESHYGFPCDIEWAFANNQFYILQSRPITTLTSVKDDRQEFRQVMNRTMFLLGAELWDLGERVELPKICSGVIFFGPLFVYSAGRGLSIYSNFTDLKQDPISVAEYFKQHDNQLDDLRSKFLLDCVQTRRLTTKANPEDFKELFQAIASIWPLITLSNILGADEVGGRFGLSENQLAKYRAMRKESDGLLHWGLETLLAMSQKLLPEDYRGDAEFLLSQEILTGQLPALDEVKRRRDSYIYYLGKIYTGEKIESFAARNNFVVSSETVILVADELSGKVAFSGLVRGRVKIVLERQDIDKVLAGDILVTPMTTPNLISAMNKAAAFVTDEGGIICHAAIIARELQKPCLIGTKTATQIFKDGDLVEVDANAGVIRKISTENR